MKIEVEQIENTKLSENFSDNMCETKFMLTISSEDFVETFRFILGAGEVESLAMDLQNKLQESILKAHGYKLQK